MSIYDRYINHIKTFILDDPDKWTFKSNPEYTYISNQEYTYMLEYVNVNYGIQYLNLIKTKYTDIYNNNKDYLITLCNTNDTYGNPPQYNFNDFTKCSPTNLRYILHSLLILEYMKDNSLDNIDCIEIGGGYGGECFFIMKLAKLYNINISSYTIFDILEASQLQQKYLNKLELNVNCYQLDNFDNLKNNSFLISNYAFSEIPLDIQNEYTTQVINPFVSYGYLCWNNIQVYNFIENSIIEKELEYPKTGKYNYYVTVKPSIIHL